MIGKPEPPSCYLPDRFGGGVPGGTPGAEDGNGYGKP